ncbi:MAG: hypothetical protein P1U70_09455 [Saprospiraceae bacterium]|jgi:hypothetical protein|nr:hypothetical protein [Saprospiraceae bacterium]
MQYEIKERTLEVNLGSLKVEIPLTADMPDALTKELTGYSFPSSIIFAVGALFAILMIGFIEVFGYAFFISMIVAIAFLTMGAIFYVKRAHEREVENLILDLESDQEFLIAKELGYTKNMILAEEEKLEKLISAKEKTELLLDGSGANEFNENELKNYHETLDHLRLRINLRSSKIEFFEKYLRRIKLCQAVNIAEEAILLDYDEEKDEMNPSALNADRVKHEILTLKPLSDQMKLCESELLAKELIKELQM